MKMQRAHGPSPARRGISSAARANTEARLARARCTDIETGNTMYNSYRNLKQFARCGTSSRAFEHSTWAVGAADKGSSQRRDRKGSPATGTMVAMQGGMADVPAAPSPLAIPAKDPRVPAVPLGLLWDGARA